MRRVFVGLATSCLLLCTSRPLLAQSAEELAKQTQIRGEPDQRALPGKLGFRHRRPRGDRHDAEHPARGAVRPDQGVERHPSRHHAGGVAADRQRRSASHGNRRHDDDGLFLARQDRQGDLGRGSSDSDSNGDQSGTRLQKFGLGPSVVALVQPGKWTVGALWNQIWSMDGVNDRPDVNAMTCSRSRTTISDRAWPSARPWRRPPTGKPTPNSGRTCCSRSAR